MKCHYLSHTHSESWGESYPEPWTQIERDTQSLPNGTAAVKCFRKVWDTEYFSDLPGMAEHLNKIVTQDMGGDCSFVKFKVGVEYETAFDLQQIQTESRRFGTTNRLVKIGIVTTAFLGALGLITQIILHFLKQNPNAGL